jgi:peroxiredoxin
MLRTERPMPHQSTAVLLALATLLVGPAAWAQDPPEVDSIAPDFSLNTLAGDEVTLSKLTAQGPVVLVVLRGFPGYQCPICTAQVGSLVGRADDLARADARVLLVYPGPAEGLQAHAEEFLAKTRLPENFTFLLDPDYAFTDAYHLRWDAPRETAYPSTFVLDRDRKVLSSRISRTHGGRSSVDEILRALYSSR